MLSDKSNDGQLLSADTYCMAEDASWNDEEIIRNGDKLRYEVRSIDRKTYDYLYSVAVGEDTSSNPLADFSGGCLGYFSAYSVSILESTFSFRYVK
ncbi:MAG: hypothetical protein LUD68_06035 [Rikenellaceae bacterium]|nr:hypothetical protein [Rikenellaceae bacterium]